MVSKGSQEKKQDKVCSFKDFLEKIQPCYLATIKDMVENSMLPDKSKMLFPEIELFCKQCGGLRVFRPTVESIWLIRENVRNDFLSYVCKNCTKEQKTYALAIVLDKIGLNGKAYKYGELPEFGPPIPPRLISIIGPEREYFLKGRRAENQGLGVAASAYYRRVVESQKDKIIDEIIKVSEMISANPELIEDLKKAKSEKQFTKAVDAIKKGIPPVLLIKGQNPLKLLHSALSQGVHELDDSECLEIAASIRVVLTELVDKMDAVLKDNAELSAAVTKLIQSRNPKPTDPQK